MQHCYYINHVRFQSGDSQKAFDFAVSLCKKDKNINTINLLVYQENQYDPFISPDFGTFFCHRIADIENQ